MRRLSAKLDEEVSIGIYRAVHLEQLALQWKAELQFLVIAKNESDILSTKNLFEAGLDNVSWALADGLESGDIVLLGTNRSELMVVYREHDTHHSIFLTNRCNSYCLMCSQPPTSHDDSWLVQEALEIVRHIRISPPVIGITGGEPLLLGYNLRKVIEEIFTRHPSTTVEILSNGRLLSQKETVENVLNGLTKKVRWLIPLYGHADFLHDYIVQVRGAFEETLDGLLTLQEYKQAIQIRIVLIKPVLELLPDLCAFIGRNLPFIQEVSLMTCEPIGFALANKDDCNVDLSDWHENLLIATRILDHHRIRYLFMNTPLCALPSQLRSAAHRSISDWKATYAPDCSHCAVKSQCCGLFVWYKRGWKPTQITPIKEAKI